MNTIEGPAHHRAFARRTSLSALALASVFALAGTTPATAADLGGDCCADLEERIAELEATTARKGNRKVSLSVSGLVNKTILHWDDGTESNTYIVGNTNDQTQFTFAGDAEIGNGWSAGYELTIFVRDTLSEEVDQDNDDGDDGFDIWTSHWWIENKTLGKVSLGRASRAVDGVPEVDLSEASDAGYAGAQEILSPRSAFVSAMAR